MVLNLHVLLPNCWATEGAVTAAGSRLLRGVVSGRQAAGHSHFSPKFFLPAIAKGFSAESMESQSVALF